MEGEKGNVNSFISLALDSSGTPHIGYYHSINHDLKYAVKSGGIWTIDTVDSPGDVGSHASLALDSSGNPHISYHDYTNRDLKYAVKSGGIWTIEIVESAAEVGSFTSLALGSSGNPHIIFFSPNEDLKYAVKSDNEWSFEIVNSDDAVGPYTSLALDSSGNPHVSHFFQAQFGFNQTIDLAYSVKSGDTWTVETINSAGNIGLRTSLVLDSNDNTHISYFTISGGGWGSNGDLTYTVSGPPPIVDIQPIYSWLILIIVLLLLAFMIRRVLRNRSDDDPELMPE